MSKVYLGDCIEIMKTLPDKSIDCIICDLPYGTTACKWDIVIPFDKLWESYSRLIKNNGAILLFGSEPFSSYLRLSNIKDYKYDWIYQKRVASNFAQAKYQPLKEHENICVFYKKQPTYNPQKEPRKGSGLQRLKAGYISNPTSGEFNSGIKSNRTEVEYDDLKYPGSVQEFNNREKSRGFHPTQKPVALMEYLIKTYTNEDDIVLDNCMSSGTTGVACKKLSRNFIGIEKELKYFEIAKKRLSEVTND